MSSSGLSYFISVCRVLRDGRQRIGYQLFFSDSLSIDISVAGPMSTISIALSSLFGVLAGGYISDRWVLKNVRGRVYTGALGLGLIIPSCCLSDMVILFLHWSWERCYSE